MCEARLPCTVQVTQPHIRLLLCLVLGCALAFCEAGSRVRQDGAAVNGASSAVSSSAARAPCLSSTVCVVTPTVCGIASHAARKARD